MKTYNRRHRLVGVATVGVLLTGLLALATPSYATSGDSVVGGGSLTAGTATEQFAINARRAGADTAATGTLTVSTAKAAAHATVSCLYVEGNTAWVGVTVVRSTPSVTPGQQDVLIFIASSPEVISDTRVHDASTCGTKPSASNAFTVTKGGFTITSAT